MTSSRDSNVIIQILITCILQKNILFMICKNYMKFYLGRADEPREKPLCFDLCVVRNSRLVYPLLYADFILRVIFCNTAVAPHTRPLCALPAPYRSAT